MILIDKKEEFSWLELVIKINSLSQRRKRIFEEARNRKIVVLL